MIDLVNFALTNFFRNIGSFLPNFFAGLLILIIGLILGSILKHSLVTIFNFLKIDHLFHQSKILGKNQLNIWLNVIFEILKWMLVIVFLIPALEIWGLSQAITVLNQFLLYLPNVIIAVIIAFVGLLTSNLSADLVKHSLKTLTAKSINSLAMFTKGLIIFFTILIVLNQLGVAQDLIKILFTGIVAMIALAGGLAFGLGGKETAKEILDNLKKKLEG